MKIILSLFGKEEPFSSDLLPEIGDQIVFSSNHYDGEAYDKVCIIRARLWERSVIKLILEEY